MKKIFDTIGTAMIAFGLAFFLVLSCSMFRKQEDRNFAASSMFCQVEDNAYWTVYYHKDTKVMWIRNKGRCGVDFEVLVDEDGKPMIWE